MLTLALALFAAQTPQPRLFMQPNLPRTSYAFFEAFPASGAGTSGPCSTTAPTGAKGEVLTFTRASSATCTKTAAGGLATTGIANGDLVSLSTNVARVEYDSNGVLGLRVEAARTNVCLQNQALELAVWAPEGAAGLPVVTANAGTAPDGTATAERVQYPATSAAQFNGMRQLLTLAAGADTFSAYVKGYSGSGTLDLCLQGASYVCAACNFVATSWTRCSVSGTGNANPYIYIGNMSLVNGGTARSANDVLVSLPQAEAGAYASSPIPTTSAAVTRAAETAYFALTAPAPAASIAATRTGPGATLTGARIFALTQTQGAAAYGLGVYHTATTGYGIVGDPTTTLSTAATQTTTQRAWASWTGVTLTANFGGTQTTSTPAVTLPARNSLSIGYDSSGGGASQADGIVSRVCLDPDPTRCR